MEENKNCGCGCGCNENENTSCDCGNDHEEPVIYVTFEDEDKEVACDVLGIFEVDDIEYIALAPQDEEEVLIYRYSEENDDIQLDEITNDEEYEKVAAEFDSMFFGDLEEAVEETEETEK
ncbi:MAG: DUF1292 domain-containing protein [Cellulosilyticaceae bacterium]